MLLKENDTHVSERFGTVGWLANAAMFAAGFVIHFPRPFAFDDADLGRDFLDRVASFDLLMAILLFVAIISKPIRIGQAYIWLVFVGWATVGVALSDEGTWSSLLVEGGAIVAGSMFAQVFAPPSARRAFECGFVVGLYILLPLLLLDAASLLLGGVPIYRTTGALRGPFFLSSQVGHHLAFSLAFLLLCRRTVLRSRIAFICLASATLALLLMSGSRSSFIAVGVGFMVFTLVSRKSNIRTAIFVAFSVWAAGNMVAESSYTEFLRNRWIDAADPLAGNSFFEIQFNTAISAWADHPVTGVGKGGFANSVYASHVDDESYEIHNTFLNILAETGTVGFLLFLIALGGVLGLVVRILKLRGGCQETALACYLISMLIIGLHGIIYRERGFWIALAYVTIAVTRQAAGKGGNAAATYAQVVGLQSLNAKEYGSFS